MAYSIPIAILYAAGGEMFGIFSLLTWIFHAGEWGGKPAGASELSSVTLG